MFSKTQEVAGLTLAAIGVALLAGAAAGLIFGGIVLIVLGGLTNDAAVGLAFRRGFGWVRYAWHRQLLRENGLPVPRLRAGVPRGWVRCDCGGQEGCPLCGGTGYAPDPDLQPDSRSPHPPLRVDVETTRRAKEQARARKERSKLRDRTPALSRYEANGDDSLERLA